MKIGDGVICLVGCSATDLPSYEEGVEYTVTRDNLQFMKRHVEIGYFKMKEVPASETPAASATEPSEPTKTTKKKSAKPTSEDGEK